MNSTAFGGGKGTRRKASSISSSVEDVQAADADASAISSSDSVPVAAASAISERRTSTRANRGVNFSSGFSVAVDAADTRFERPVSMEIDRGSILESASGVESARYQSLRDKKKLAAEIATYGAVRDQARAEVQADRIQTTANLPAAMANPDYVPTAKDMQDAETDVNAAQLKFWESTGLQAYPELARLSCMNPNDLTDDDIAFLHKLAEKIRTESLFRHDLDRILNEWHGTDQEGAVGNLSIHRRIYCCGVCGTRDISPSCVYEKCLITKTNPEEEATTKPDGKATVNYSYFDPLLLNAVHDQEMLKLEQYQDLASVWPPQHMLKDHPELSGKRWFLQPELVENDGTDYYTMCCPKCDSSLRKNNQPEFSTYFATKVTERIDFGNQARFDKFNLGRLTLAEKFLIARVRLYGSIIQLHEPPAYDQYKKSARTLFGHVISFFHDGPNELAAKMTSLLESNKSFPNHEGLARFIEVVFLGKAKSLRDLKIGNRLRSNNAALFCDFDKVIRWLNMLKVVNPLYNDIIIDDSTKRKDAVNAALDDLVSDKNLFAVESDAHVRLFAKIQDNVAGVRSCDDGAYDLHDTHVQVPNRDDMSVDTSAAEPVLRSDSDDDVSTAPISKLSNVFLGNHQQTTMPQRVAKYMTDLKKQLFPVNTMRPGLYRPPVDRTKGDSCESDDEPPNVELEIMDGILQVSRESDEPINEFGENDQLFAYSLPWCYPFGKFGIPTSSFGLPYRCHTLRQASCVFAHEPWFYFLVP